MTQNEFDTSKPYLKPLLAVINRQQAGITVDTEALDDLILSLTGVTAYVVFTEEYDDTLGELIVNQFQSQLTADNLEQRNINIANQVASLLSLNGMTLEELNDILDPEIPG